MRTVKWFSCFWAAGLAGCSLYPIPDDVTPIRTEDIVRHARCEIRSEIIGYLIDRGFIAPSATEKEIVAFAKNIQIKDKKKQKLDDIETYILRLMEVRAAYSFDFNITENNTANGAAGFKLPFTGPKVLDAGASASLALTRVGLRVFSTGDRWDDLIMQSTRCTDVRPRPGNFVYPLDGSIGVGRAVRTFIDIADQGGAKDSFVDTLTFTTRVGGDANASIKLEAVPHSFRLVSASASLGGSRLDIHKMVVSLVFPRPPAPVAPAAITEANFQPGYLNAPFQRPADWRARYNLCVADARQREDSFKMLRYEPPEVYCITYADAFAPKTGQEGSEPEVRGPAQPESLPPSERARGPRLRPNRP
jgi:hypothetical protein